MSPSFAPGPSPRDFRREGAAIRIGPFVASLRSPIPMVAEWVLAHYADQFVTSSQPFIDFHISIAAPSRLRRWVRPQVLFDLDGRGPFNPLPQDQAFACFEWGLNWCIAQFAHHFLMIHAAVVERGGRAIVMPGYPGSGKSTLCAGLVSQGWRLLSDEFALVSPADRSLTALPRPISLKNRAIDLIRERLPDALIGPIVPDTKKGTLAHLKAPLDSVRRADERARPAWLVFPEYDADGDRCNLQPLSKGRALMAVADSSFNYPVLGAEGFRTVADLVDQCECFSLTYRDLDAALATLDDLATSAEPAPSTSR